MFDRNTGLQYNCLRWYDPRLSRFVSQDPSGFLFGDANLYRYVHNSPLDYTDPWGLHENELPPVTNPSTGDVQYQIGDPSWNAGVPPTPISQIPPPNLVPNPFNPNGPPIEIVPNDPSGSGPVSTINNIITTLPPWIQAIINGSIGGSVTKGPNGKYNGGEIHGTIKY